MSHDIGLKPDGPQRMRFDAPSLRSIGWQVFYDVNRTLGGLAAMELLRRSFGGRGWINDENHALFVAVSRFTPGTNILAYCVALGWQLAGWPGALVALYAASVPASIIIALLTSTLESLSQHPFVQAVIAVALIVATLLVVWTAWNLLRPYVKGANAVRTGLLGAIVIVLMLMGVTPIRILLVAAVLGAVMAPEEPSVAEVDR